MTADQRIEKLLNRAGQTISDLQKATEFFFAHSVNNPEAFGNVMMAACKFNGLNGDAYYFKDFDAVRVLVDYVMHQADVIDRLESALENTCNERDYLAYRLNWLSMYRHRDCQSCERVYECERTHDHCLGWVFGGVPEDWSVDDENR